MECPCPLPTALTAIPNVTCVVSIDQISKLLFQRAGYKFATEVAAQTLATWTGLKSATDDTKVISTTVPLYNPIIPESEAITEGGGDNTTPDGLAIYKGENTITFTAQLRGLSKEAYQALKKLPCETAASLSNSLVVYMVNRHGNIWMDTTNLTGIPIRNFRISTRGSQGFNANDTYTISFTMDAEWDNDLGQIVPTDFNARLEL